MAEPVVTEAPTTITEQVPEAIKTAEPTGSTTPAPEVEEPQNALTKKFTDTEWKALKEFRVRG